MRVYRSERLTPVVLALVYQRFIEPLGEADHDGWIEATEVARAIDPPLPDNLVRAILLRLHQRALVDSTSSQTSALPGAEERFRLSPDGLKEVEAALGDPDNPVTRTLGWGGRFVVELAEQVGPDGVDDWKQPDDGGVLSREELLKAIEVTRQARTLVANLRLPVADAAQASGLLDAVVSLLELPVPQNGACKRILRDLAVIPALRDHLRRYPGLD